MARYMPPGSDAAVTLDVNGQRRTWRLDDLESFVLRPCDVRDLDDLEQPGELTEDVTLPADGGRITRTWYKSPPPPPRRPRTTQAELYHLVRAWLCSSAPSGPDDAGLGFLTEELRQHGEDTDLWGFLTVYEDRQALQAMEEDEWSALADGDGDD